MTDKIHSRYSLTGNEPAVKKFGVSVAETMPSPANCIRKTLCVLRLQWRKGKFLGFSMLKNLWLLGSWKSSNMSKPAYWQSVWQQRFPHPQQSRKPWPWSSLKENGNNYMVGFNRRYQIETVEFTCKACFSEGFLHVSLDKEKMSFIDIGRGNIE